MQTPREIQEFLDSLHYDPEGGAHSPKVVMRTRMAQCYSGAIFAASALRDLGYGARIMWMDAVEDDGHCIALYEKDGFWGSVAKSNFTTIRSREPVYSYHELGMSYFDGFYNQFGKRSMRAFTEPIDLSQFDRLGWTTDEGDMEYVDEAIDSAPRAWKLPDAIEKNVEDVSEALRQAGLLGSNPEGLWRPS